MGYGGNINIKLPWQFGDGSDGDLHIQSNTTIAKDEYNLQSLEIDAGFYLSAPSWAASYIPIVSIRCRTAIKLNGIIRANGVSGCMQTSAVSTTANPMPGNEDGKPPQLYYSTAGVVVGVEQIYPIAGGGNGTYGSWIANMPYAVSIVGYTATKCNGDPSAIFNGDRDALIGPGRPFRYCAGCGGAAGSNYGGYGGTGGGILRIYAPAIIFGEGGGIQAKGANASGSGGDNNAGGGGGGYVEVITQTALSGSDWAKVLVTGGTGLASGYAGLDGHKVRQVIS